MKTRGQIEQQLKQVIYRHLQKRLRANFKQTPQTCRHNQVLDLGGNGTLAGVGVCCFTEDGIPRGVVCDTRADDGARARDCIIWEEARSKADVKAEFQAVLDSGNPGIIAAQFPDVAALLWVLEEPGALTLEDPDPDPGQEEMEMPVGWDWGNWPWSKRAKA